MRMCISLWTNTFISTFYVRNVRSSDQQKKIRLSYFCCWYFSCLSYFLFFYFVDEIILCTFVRKESFGLDRENIFIVMLDVLLRTLFAQHNTYIVTHRSIWKENYYNVDEGANTSITYYTKIVTENIFKNMV